MARRRRLNRSLRRDAPSRQWHRFMVSATDLSTGPTQILSLANAEGNLDFTIMRIRGRLAIGKLDSDAQYASAPVGAFGMGVMTTPAWAAGPTAIPTPIAEEGWAGWMVWQPINSLPGRFTPADDSDEYFVQTQYIDIDVKAMRKFPEGNTLGMVAEIEDVGVRFALGLSVLIQLKT